MFRTIASHRAAPLFAVALLGAALFGAACNSSSRTVSAAPSKDPLTHGKYLVDHVGGCNDCHTAMTPQGPDMNRYLLGSELSFVPKHPVPGWKDLAPRISGLPNGWTKEHMAEFLMSGKKPGGEMAAPPMPPFRMNEEDANAVAEYLASLPSGKP